MTGDRPPAEVIDRREEHRFVVDVDGIVAELVYQEPEGELILVHTGVPDELEGRGIGSLLVRAAVERAEAEERTVVPWCPFARSWLERHPEDAERVEIDWRPAGT